jgi:hypothetical protein
MERQTPALVPLSAHEPRTTTVLLFERLVRADQSGSRCGHTPLRWYEEVEAGDNP